MNSGAAPAAARGGLRPRARKWRNAALPAAFLLPAVAFVAVVSIYPIFDAVSLSVHATSYAQVGAFIGLRNYVALAFDPGIWRDGRNSLIYTAFSLALVLPYSMGLAILLNRPIPGRGLFRTLIIMPWVTSQTITALVWGWLLNGDYGALTYLLQLLAGHRIAVLASPAGAMATLIGINVWASYPLATLLFLAALQTVPKELYEAASVDGASRWGSFAHVTAPMIRPTALVVIIQLTLLYLNMVTLIYVLTGGGPLNGTETLAVTVLKMSFQNWEIGKGAALGMVLTAINVLFSLVYMRALRGGEP